MQEDKEWPLVTVFTLVYNTGKYVVQGLESVRANNYPNVQHIIIDDCSTDGVSVDIVQDWIDKHQYSCIFIRHQTNQGICRSLNEIISLTKGKYFFGVSDDLLTSTRIYDHVKIFETSEPNVAVVFSDVEFIDIDGQPTNASAFTKVRQLFGRVPEGNVYYELFRYNFIPAMGATIRTSSLTMVGNFDETLYFEDWDMWLRLSKKFSFRKGDSLGGFYRRYPTSIWNSATTKNIKCCLDTLLKNLTNRKSKQMAKANLLQFAEEYYKINAENVAPYFFKIGIHTFSIKAIFFWLFASLRLSYDQFQQMRTYFRMLTRSHNTL